ncbi:Histidine phosphatase superfamily,Phosphoglycerate mutase 1,Histidine [Cinara cedri]|uniref:phosphoglycerate mutase (2,3-diphosphoglycerate-dependent) n=1 Tax=Cinara cedri TaxID=506608 RepID=A0A5E4N1T8_9HEMI|nr:Histidine phosphatase superfamily,Phosphoglycerate mutase 1,Histidine [Cinara cedri]
MTGNRIVVMARHGESEWSKNNVFCGWYDSLLSDRGMVEAMECAELLRQSNFKFDRAYTSLLTRAHQTLKIITNQIDQPNLPVEESWRLNERHYGALTGFNKAELVNKYGEKQVHIWRRSFDVLPPEMESSHKYYKAIWRNPKIVSAAYASNEKFPNTESLKETMERVIPYWKDYIVPSIQSGQRVLIVAHGTVLRSLIKYLDGVSDYDICSINIPSGIPFVYKFGDDMKVVSSRKFLGDRRRIEEGIARAATIGTH